MSHDQNTSQHNNKQYVIAVLPKRGPVLNICVEKYRSFRFQVLEDSPASLAGSLEIEQNLPYSHFANLVTQPRRHIIVAIEAAANCSSKDDALVNGTWVGVEHVIGSIPLSEWIWPNVGGLRPDEEEGRWHIFNLFVAPGHRGPARLMERMKDVCLQLCIEETRRLLAPKANAEGRKTLMVRQRCCFLTEIRGLERAYKKLGWQSAGIISSEASLRAAEPGYGGDGNPTGTIDHTCMERIFHISTRASDGDVEVQSRL